MHGEPTLFDMAEFEREAVAATPWEGVPLRYVTDYHHPDDLAAAFERWTGEHGNFGCLMRSHMWHRAYFGRQDVAASDEAHELHMLNADTRCDLAEHDHAMPGWRALPILPTNLSTADEKKARAAAAKWCAENYPAEWQRPGAPVISRRGPYGGRHVGGRSPFGGYDLAAPND
ncbi:DUF6349 family protein [Leucobacter triazinivorans]|uniref:Uncharacterized protein n=1 Tax=Leucobacter triazinivorans TaxID=1784719 RepID=A0A4P6KH15_9MICO|nr:DUF6349 family protein [Leucobacter triazinivorans]QBE49622.1 hypothetical protein EVS81_12960 [Leucobacter triazinivorans]